MLRNWLIWASIAVVGVAAAVESLQGGSKPEPERAGKSGAKAPEDELLSGPDVPAPGVLPGTLFVARSGSPVSATRPSSCASSATGAAR